MHVVRASMHNEPKRVNTLYISVFHIVIHFLLHVTLNKTCANVPNRQINQKTIDLYLYSKK